MNLNADWPLPSESSLIKQKKLRTRRLTLAGNNRGFDRGNVASSEGETHKRCLKLPGVDKVSTKSVSWEDAEFRKSQAD